MKTKLLSSLGKTVVRVTCRLVSSCANWLGAAFAPFADVLVEPLLDAACVRRPLAEDPTAISLACEYCVEALAKSTCLSVPKLRAYYKAARATRKHRTEGGKSACVMCVCDRFS